MNIIRTRNVHRALPLALELLRTVGVKRTSRNGDVLVSASPVSTVYDNPTERVLFWADRDANPFFHFYESLWMLAGRDDVPSTIRFVKNFGQFSDDGKVFHGAYGHRWRKGMPAEYRSSPDNFGELDQLPIISDALKENKFDRRQVLQMWDSQSDLTAQKKDVPCNLTATFQADEDDNLNMVVFNRSNDIIWGCYGANAVHFSYLLEYVAGRAGLAVGTYTQISVNWHGYTDLFTNLYEAMLVQANSGSPEGATEGDLTPLIEETCPYGLEQVVPYPLMHKSTPIGDWDASLQQLVKYCGKTPSAGRFMDPFFEDVAIPILKAHDAYKDQTGEKRFTNSLKEIELCRASDWRLACSEWLMRRYRKFTKDSDDGPIHV